MGSPDIRPGPEIMADNFQRYLLSQKMIDNKNKKKSYNFNTTP